MHWKEFWNVLRISLEKKKFKKLNLIKETIQCEKRNRRDSVWSSKAIAFSEAGNSVISHLTHMFYQGLWII